MTLCDQTLQVYSIIIINNNTFPGFLGEVIDFRAKAGDIKDDPGASSDVKKYESF